MLQKIKIALLQKYKYSPNDIVSVVRLECIMIWMQKDPKDYC